VTRRAGAALAALGLAATVALGWAAHARVPPAVPVHAAARWPVQAGDVVVRGGAGLWSGTFARLNPRDTRFSHAGVVVRAHGAWQVVHAQADDLGRQGRVRMDPWAHFAAAPRVAVLRLDDAAAAGRTARAALALHAAGAPFDFAFDLADATRVYCTELVWLALRDALGTDPLPAKPRLRGQPAVLVENLLHGVPALRLAYLEASAPTHAAGADRR
jgi:hypothetical protein